MSGFDGWRREGLLGWMSPRGVAPERMPKADATGLAPDNRHTPLAGEILPEGFFIARIVW